MAIINRFISKDTDQYLSFFKEIQKKTEDLWMEECEQVFNDLKEHMGKAPYY